MGPASITVNEETDAALQEDGFSKGPPPEMQADSKNNRKSRAQIFVRQEIRQDQDIQANVVNNAAMWTKVHSVPSGMRRSRFGDDKASEYSMNLGPETQRFLSELSEKLTRRLSSKYSIETADSTFDMNELPYVSQMRSMFLIVCGMSFFVSPFAYMTLGTIQASFLQKCFLFTRPSFNFITKESNNTEGTYKTITLDAIDTEWGPTSYCEFTTFTPVSVAIFNIIMGWSTFTIWPLMMSLGKGGVLMIMYAIISIVSLVAVAVSTLFVRDGYLATCQAMREDYKMASLTCADLNNDGIAVLEVRDFQMVKDVHRAMMFAETAGWCLTGLALLQVLICTGTFGIIWFHFHISPLDLFQDLDSDDDDDDFSTSV